MGPFVSVCGYLFEEYEFLSDFELVFFFFVRFLFDLSPVLDSGLCCSDLYSVSCLVPSFCCQSSAQTSIFRSSLFLC